MGLGTMERRIQNNSERIQLFYMCKFTHLHELDVQYHLSQETGALDHIIDQRSHAINFILSSMVFNLILTILEISMVSGILAYKSEHYLHGSLPPLQQHMLLTL
ncbi:unnamed protein product [Coffea canephora]|uniref:Uncharacterized protein n=1 Tax=Coffea canephora TaxID=49390 RepID=A0A068V5Q8_COFCA|nr:unnamed protein product [Coffea canephora]